MGEVFLSYAREDAAAANALADALTEDGFAVWADVSSFILGDQYDEVVAQALGAAKCVVVLWSQYSVQSPWVKDEAAFARDRGTLVPVLIESVSPPMGFGSIHTGKLIGWDGDRGAPEYQALVKAMRHLSEGREKGSALADRPPERTPVVPPSQRLQNAIAEAAGSGGAETDEPATEQVTASASIAPTGPETATVRPTTSLPPPGAQPPPTGASPDREGRRRLALIAVGTVAVAAVVLGLVAFWPSGDESGATSTTVAAVGGADGLDLTARTVTDFPGFDASSDAASVTTSLTTEGAILVTASGTIGGEVQGVLWRVDGGTFAGDPVRLTYAGAGDEVFALAELGGVLVAGGDRNDSAAVFLHSEDGATWQEGSIQPNSEPPASVRDIASTQQGLVAVGHTTTEGAPRAAALWTSSDGIEWQRMAGITSADAPEEFDSVAADGSVVVAVGRRGNAARDEMRPLASISQDGGATWEEVSVPSVGDDSRIQAVTWSGSDFVGVGWSNRGDVASPVVWRSPDGLGWEVVWNPGAAAGGVSGIMVQVASTDVGLVATGREIDGGRSTAAAWIAESGDAWSRAEWLPPLDDATQGQGSATAVEPLEGGVFIAGWESPDEERLRPLAWIVAPSN